MTEPFDVRLQPSPKNLNLPPGVVAYLKKIYAIARVKNVTDNHLATGGYYNQMGGSTSVEECDRMYNERKYDWQASIAELRAQRAAQNLPEDLSAHI